MKITEHKPSDKFWTDEKGVQIPVSRVTPTEKRKERSSAKLATEATRLNSALSKFKDACAAETEKAYQEDLKAGKAASKGGYTLYNFDRSIKVERSLNEMITFDENLIGAAKEKFDQFLTEGTAGVDDMIRQLIMDAFSSTRKGKLDSKKVMNLLTYKQRISEHKYPAFHDALNLIEQSIRRPDSRIYYRISVKDENGEYQNIDLNFSSI
jgi:hypothetical protein